MLGRSPMIRRLFVPVARVDLRHCMSRLGRHRRRRGQAADPRRRSREILCVWTDSCSPGAGEVRVCIHSKHRPVSISSLGVHTLIRRLRLLIPHILAVEHPLPLTLNHTRRPPMSSHSSITIFLTLPPTKNPPNKRQPNNHRCHTPHHNPGNRTAPKSIPILILILIPIHVLKQGKLIRPRRRPRRRPHIFLGTPVRRRTGIRRTAAHKRRVREVTREPVLRRDVDAVVWCEALKDVCLEGRRVYVWAGGCVVAVGVAAGVGRAAADEVGGAGAHVPCPAGGTGEGARVGPGGAVRVGHCVYGIPEGLSTRGVE